MHLGPFELHLWRFLLPESNGVVYSNVSSVFPLINRIIRGHYSTRHCVFIGEKTAPSHEKVLELRIIIAVLSIDDDDCFYYHSWRNNVVIAFGTLSS